jgi:hypothetical protein
MFDFLKSKRQKGALYLKDFGDKIVLAKRFNGISYYNFKDDLDMPYGRYLYLASFLQAIEMRMNLETLQAYIKKLQDNLSGGKGKIDIGASVILLKQLETRTTILFDEDLAYNLASCVFFTDDEPLNTYSVDYNKKKIEGWREVGALDFFMLMPVRELLGLRNLSVSDLEAYLQKSREIKNQLNIVMQQALSKDA